jgi:RecA/RadA recombinase
MPAPNVIRLQALLSEKFSRLRLPLGEQPSAKNKFWPTGLAFLDQALHGGLPKGALSEIVSPDRSAGTAMLMHELLHHAAQENQIIAVIDGHDSLDVTQIEESTLARLLWVRARSAEEALKAADFILRDGNLLLVLLDLKLNSEKEIRKILK